MQHGVFGCGGLNDVTADHPADMLLHAVTLTVDSLTLNIYNVSAVTLSNSVQGLVKSNKLWCGVIAI